MFRQIQARCLSFNKNNSKIFSFYFLDNYIIINFKISFLHLILNILILEKIYRCFKASRCIASYSSNFSLRSHPFSLPKLFTFSFGSSNILLFGLVHIHLYVVFSD